MEKLDGTPKAELLALKKETGARLKDLVVLAPNNDPFNAGSPTDVKVAQWFAHVFQGQGFTKGVHLRRVHYVLISLDEKITRHDGQPYENTEASWDYLEKAAKKARYLGLVDAQDFVDRRNPEAMVYAPEPREAGHPT